MSQTTTRITASGTYLLTGRSPSNRPLVQIDASSDFVGSVIFYNDTGTVSSGRNLVAVSCREPFSANPVFDHAAGVAFGADISVEPFTSGLPLYAVVTFTPDGNNLPVGNVVLTCLPEWAGTPDRPTLYFGDLTLTNLPFTVQEDLGLMLEESADQAADVTT